MTAAPGKDGEKDFSLYISRAGCSEKEQGLCVVQRRVLTLNSLAGDEKKRLSTLKLRWAHLDTLEGSYYVP